MEIGVDTFVETTPDVQTGETISHAERLRQVVEEIVLADKVELDIFGVGEHHRKEFGDSATAVILAAAAAVTQRIRLTSSVTVLSAADPVRLFQQFATLDGISNGRAEIIAGRGSMVDAFPLFGYDLKDYEVLFEEKLELLLKLRDSEKVTWKGGHRPAFTNLGVYPRPVQDPLPIWLGSGGNSESVIRAGVLGLPLVLAIIGGSPLQFAPLVPLYKKAATHAGHDASKLKIAVHSLGFVAESTSLAVDKYFRPTQASFNYFGKERGWGHYSRANFDAASSLEGALYVGDPETVANKIIYMYKHLGFSRFFLHLPVGTMPHDDVMKAIELLGTEVAPRVREEVARLDAVEKSF
ncbi:F420-dependent glucose-6-phosphate dehydrogenase [Paenibacillus allorhizoplanae]|uniref:F420-dependent glucose-6-phosphate dehydrogenase n=1 Tax=Paenibacillus allorhizoplanae TaxID=2905648 RepID=A0ABN8FYS9_9BACL|nr:Atu2307/SP_0267 family LLM class monooxygenase [Paenibacillus allorhizoplanae]CAH1195134.1 F420-dependent glucose-6-phosphate dehydrogenase [Paenibacillus allorhizoplanae]